MCHGRFQVVDGARTIESRTHDSGCNNDDSGGCDRGVWGCTNAARGAACSNSGGGAGSIRDSMSVDGAVRGDSSGHGGDEARDAAGEALVVGIGVAFGRGGIEAGGGCDKGACDGGGWTWRLWLRR